jgi:hypothetical protein
LKKKESPPNSSYTTLDNISWQKDTGYGLLQHTIAETGCGMNFKPGQLPTYKALFPVLKTKTAYI